MSARPSDLLVVCIWIIVIASAIIMLEWKKKEKRGKLNQKINSLPVLMTCQSSISVMLSCKVNDPVCHSWKHLIVPDMANDAFD